MPPGPAAAAGARRTVGRRDASGGAVGSCERATATMSNKLLAALLLLGPCSLSHSGGCALALTVPQCSSEAIKGGQMGGGDYHNLEQQAGGANATACRAECCPSESLQDLLNLRKHAVSATITCNASVVRQVI